MDFEDTILAIGKKIKNMTTPILEEQTKTSLINSIILLFLNRLPWKIKLFDNNKEKIQIENLNDLYKYADRIISIASGYINKN